MQTPEFEVFASKYILNLMSHPRQHTDLVARQANVNLIAKC